MDRLAAPYRGPRPILVATMVMLPGGPVSMGVTRPYACNRIIRPYGTIILPYFLPLEGWSRVGDRGYIGYTGRDTFRGIIRGARLHRMLVEHLLGDTLSLEFHIHHQDGNKLNNCPGNLVLCYHAGFNPAPTRQCPFTGRYLTVDQYRRLEAK